MSQESFACRKFQTFKKSRDPQFVEGKPADNESAVVKFAKQKVSRKSDDDYCNAGKPSGKGSCSKRGKCKLDFDCNGICILPMNVFENQVIPVGIHNFSKGFRPNLATIRVASMGTKFIPIWVKANTKNTFRRFNDFKNKINSKLYLTETKRGVLRKTIG